MKTYLVPVTVKSVVKIKLSDTDLAHILARPRTEEGNSLLDDVANTSALCSMEPDGREVVERTLLVDDPKEVPNE